MKRIIFLLPVVLIALAACDLDNSDYPRRIHFGVDGGTRQVRGSRATTSLTICPTGGGKTLADMDDYTYGLHKDSFIMGHDWLEVKGKVVGGKFTITAMPY